MSGCFHVLLFEQHHLWFYGLAAHRSVFCTDFIEQIFAVHRCFFLFCLELPFLMCTSWQQMPALNNYVLKLFGQISKLPVQDHHQGRTQCDCSMDTDATVHFLMSGRTNFCSGRVNSNSKMISSEIFFPCSGNRSNPGHNYTLSHRVYDII